MTGKRPFAVLAAILIVSAALAYAIVWGIVRPSHSRVWMDGQERLPYVRNDSGAETIHNVRDFRYRDRAVKPLASAMGI